MIQIENLIKDYGKGESCTHALRGINLHITAGSFTSIVGTSGSGKSTLLHILGGMDTPTSGKYLFEGTPVFDFNKAELHRFRKEKISFVFQNFSLMSRYTVYENVEMPLLARRIKNRKEIVMRNLERLGIAELKSKLPSHLSGGQQQRCAIARALAADTPVLLADEPTGSLDQRTGNEIMQYFEEIHKSGKTIILITHNMRIAQRCEDIIRIEDGLLSKCK